MNPSASITVVPIGGIKTWFLPRVRHALREAFEREVASEPAMPMPSSAWHPDRRQSAVSVLIAALATARLSGSGCVLGVTDADLFAPGYGYVYGRAERQRGVAVCSIRRLAMGQEIDVFLDAVASHAVHLMGSLHGLERCSDRGCVMWAPGSIVEMAKNRGRFCPAHAAELAVLAPLDRAV